MRAVMFRDFRTFPTIENIDVPEPGPGEVLLKVAGAGACHSDVAIFHEFDADPNNGLMTPPFVLGHETAGWIEALGLGVRGLEVGAPYLVYGPSAAGPARLAPGGRTRTARTQARSATSPLGWVATVAWPST